LTVGSIVKHAGWLTAQLPVALPPAREFTSETTNKPDNENNLSSRADTFNFLCTPNRFSQQDTIQRFGK
jgi:hypothetical protein